MKKTLLFSMSLFTASFCIAQFNSDDLPREAGFTDSFILSSSAYTVPAHGSGLTWDFSVAVTDELFTREYFDATNDPNFPGALSYRERNQIFQGFLIESNEYDLLNSERYAVLGRSVTDVVYPITAITGGANDVLRFVGGNYIHNGNQDNLQFPFDFGDSWTSQYEHDMPFELTVAGFGLNATPGVHKRFFTQTREVVGKGSFIIPDENGDPSNPIPGYLLLAELSAIDSVFLAGNPAPPALMAAFGLTQGSEASQVFYVAYVNGFGSPLFSMDTDGEFVFNYAYRPQAAELGQTVSIQDLNQESLSIFPNPIAAGQMLTIQNTASEPVVSVDIISATGKKLQQLAVNTSHNSQITIEVPSSLVNGMYFIRLLNANGNTVSQSNFIVR